MAIPALIAGAGVGARGLAAYLAKKKAKDMAKKSVMKAGYGGSNATKIHDAMVMSPRAAAMASARGRVYPDASRFVSNSRSSKGGPVGFGARLGAATAGIGAIDAMTQQPNGGDLHPRVEAMDRLRNGGGMIGLSRNQGYMANPMMGKSHDPSYEASKTRAGKVQTMMEEMDGMDISEEGKRQIIEDKLRLPYGYLEDVGLEMAWGGDRFDGGYSGDLRQETGAAYTDEEIQEFLRGRTGAATTREELGMFMGMPRAR